MERLHKLTLAWVVTVAGSISGGFNISAAPVTIGQTAAATLSATNCTPANSGCNAGSSSNSNGSSPPNSGSTPGGGAGSGAPSGSGKSGGPASSSTFGWLAIPGGVAVISSAFAYLYTQVQKWRAVRSMLEIEINHLLIVAFDNLEFLERSPHYWLKAGSTLSSAPKSFPPSVRIFEANIAELHLLRRANASKVLAFYEHYEFCENLRASLFERVAEFKESKLPLTEDDVKALQARLHRAIAAYKDLQQNRSPIRIGQLKNSYTIPSTKPVLDSLNSNSSPTQLVENLTEVKYV
jgi:hypothetical protein